jgi:hypothetical protein
MEPRKKRSPDKPTRASRRKNQMNYIALDSQLRRLFKKSSFFFHVETIPPACFLTPESCRSAACPPRHLGLDFWQSLDNQTFKQGPRAFFEPAIGAQIPVDVFGVRDNR